MEHYSGHPEWYEKKQYETYESMQMKGLLLSTVIEERIKEGLMPAPTRILVIPRGGYFVTDTFARTLAIPTLANLSLTAKSYDDETNTSGRVEFGQVPSVEFVFGQNVLMVDEVCETGQTLKAAHEMMMRMGAWSVSSAVIHHKPEKAKHASGYQPDAWAELTDNWIVYPSENLDQRGIEFNKELVRLGLRQPKDQLPNHPMSRHDLPAPAS